MKAERTRAPLLLAVALLALPLLLSSCLSRIFETCTNPRVVDLSSPRTLAGVWTGTIRDDRQEGSAWHVTLDLDATYRDEEAYDVAGTFTIGDEPPHALTGTVHGGCYEEYLPSAVADLSPAMQPPPPTRLDAQARDADENQVWHVTAIWGEILADPDERPFSVRRVDTIDGTERESFLGGGLLTRERSE